LAVALARSGNNVALVDLDLRQPALGSLFGIHRLSGLTDVVARKPALDDALVSIALPPIVRDQPQRGVDQTSLRGALYVLPSGPLPVSPGEFVASQALAARVLEPLRDRFDYVLVDTPPTCRVSDASALSARMDAIVVVARLGVVNRPALRDLRRQLATTPVRALGFVVTDVEVPSAYSYSGYFEPSAVALAAAGNGKRPAAAPERRTRA